MLIVNSLSHLDHALTPEHIAFIVASFDDRSSFFIATVEMPTYLPALPCAIYGPICGDDPISDDQVYMTRRGERYGESRMIARPLRMSRVVTVIAGKHESAGNDNLLLYTAYGGPSCPREPFDPSLITEEEKKEAADFWSQHALAAHLPTAE